MSSNAPDRSSQHSQTEEPRQWETEEATEQLPLQQPGLNDQADLEEDLFGGEEDDDSLDSGGEISPDQDQDTNQRNPLEYDEDSAAPTRNLHIAEAALPNLPFPRPSDGKHWDLRIPNFLSLNPLPFSDEDFLNEENDSDKEGGESGNSKLFADQNVIRWRWRKDSNGKPVKQSNTRVICWEDGTQSLQVGSELFDMVYTIDNQHPNNSTHSSQSSGTTQGLTYLFAQYSELMLLEAQASITGQINLRPHTLNSLTHRTIVANRTFRKAHSQRQTASRVITADPEKEKIDKEMEEERKLKELKKMESKLARKNSRQAFISEGGKGTGSSGGVRKRRFNAPLLSDDGELGNLEEDEEEDYEEEVDEYENEEPDDGAHGQRRSTQNEPELTELELADQRLEQQERDRKKRPNHDSYSTDPLPDPVSIEPKVIKRKLIIASDDDD